MSFIAKNPLTISEVKSSPRAPKPGTRGVFAGQDGWYDIDSNNTIKKIATTDDIGGGGGGMTPEQVTQLDKNTDDINKINVNIGNIEAAQTTHEQRIHDVEINIADMIIDFSTMNSQMSALSQTLDDVQTTQGSYDTRLNNLEERISSVEMDSSRLDDKILSLNEQIGDINSALDIIINLQNSYVGGDS